MTVCGIIAEFNPFHNGHAYLFEQARALTRADHLVVVMSGDFVQRGEPACMDKYTRAKIALSCGADAVFELPVGIATASAQYFARGAIASLKALGIVDHVCFGSEDGNLKLLQSKANDHPSGNPTRHVRDIETPNNILSLEYLRALDFFQPAEKTPGRRITPVTVKRAGAGYHDQEISDNGFCSASAVRDLLRSVLENPNREFSNALSPHVPDGALFHMESYYHEHNFTNFDSLSDLLFYQLLRQPVADLTDYFDVYHDLADKIGKTLSGKRPVSASEFRAALKTKDIAFSHISRALVHILLQTENSDIDALKGYGYCAYLRMLGFRKDAEPLMKAIKTSAKRPVITKLADAKKQLEDAQYALLQKDIAASDLYQQISRKKEPAALFPGEYRQPVIII